jgi:hypothetical protein
VFQFLQASRVTGINFTFEKSSQKEVWHGNVWRSRWPKGHAQQCAHKRTLAVKQLLCSQCGPSLLHVETSSPFQVLPTKKLTVSEDSDTVLRCLLKSQWSHNSSWKCCYLSLYCLIRYFHVRKRIAKCFTNSSKRFR